MVAHSSLTEEDNGYEAQEPVQEAVVVPFTITELASFGVPDNNPHDLDSESERKAYYDNLHLDPNLDTYSPNDVHLSLVNNGNDAALRDYISDMDANSGMASKDNNVTARLGDAMMQAPDNSTADEMLSQDASFRGKENAMEERQENHHLNEDEAESYVYMPPDDEYSLEQLKDQMVQDMLELDGIDESDVQMVLAADAAGDIAATMKALDAVADKYDLGDMKDGVELMQVGLDDMLEEANEVATVVHGIKPPEDNYNQEVTLGLPQFT